MSVAGGRGSEGMHVTEADPLQRLCATLRDLVTWFAKTEVPAVIIGGVAASLLGRPRVTRDVGVVPLLTEARWDSFPADGARWGFVPRRADVIEFARRSQVLLLRHSPSGVDVDASLGALPFEERVIRRSKVMKVAGVRIPLPRPEDLIVMKAVASRARDLADIEAILDANPRITRRRTLDQIAEFAQVLEIPELLERARTLFELRRRRRT